MRGGALFGPNVTWGASLYVGGNGRVGTNASVAVTNGNLHIDSQDGYNLYLNWYNTASIFTQSNLGVGSSSASYRLHVHGTGYATSDFRAPIFYDSNDTGYFCDPNGRSNFSQANFPNGLQFSGSFCLVNSGATLDNSTGMRMTESYGAVWNGSNGATWHHQVVNASSLCGFNASGGNFGNGNILASGNITAYYSDERLKTKLTTIENALDKVRSLEGFIYVENDLAKSLGYTNSGEQAGVSAQRVKAVLPQAVSLAPVDMQGVPETGEIVSKSGENYLTVDYSRIVPLLIEAIKEQDTEVTTLRSQLQQQQSELDELKSLVKSLLANR
jgi:chaperonin cofactor prefoldin